MRKLLVLVVLVILAVQVTEVFLLRIETKDAENIPTPSPATIEFEQPDHGNFSIEEILMDPCLSDEDCKTPESYMLQSRCPFTSYCLENRCAVVCPKPDQEKE